MNLSKAPRSPFRLIGLAMALIAFALPARAHFIWLHIRPTPQVSELDILFGEGPYLDSDPNLVRYIDAAQVWSSESKALQVAHHGWGQRALLSRDARWVAATCDMGTFDPPTGGDSVRLLYDAKGVRDLAQASERAGLDLEIIAEQREEGAGSKQVFLQAFWKGEPLPQAEFHLRLDGEMKSAVVEGDEFGRVWLPPVTGGLLQARVKFTIDEEGIYKEKPFAAIVHHSTLTLSTLLEGLSSGSGDLEAHQRFDDARNLLWSAPANVQGFGGVVKVHYPGGVARAGFQVLRGGNGSLELEEVPQALRERVESEVREVFRGLLGERWVCGESSRALLHARGEHPHGRAMEFLGDTLQSVRIHERMIRFYSSTDASSEIRQVFFDHEKFEGRVLPKQIARSVYLREGGKLIESSTISDQFKLTDGMVLPTWRRVTTATSAVAPILELEFRNHEILEEVR